MKTVVNKVICSVSVMALVVVGFMSGGCDLNPEQIKIIARSSGRFAAAAWVGADNPDREAMQNVAELLAVVTRKAEDIKVGQSCSELMLPEIEKHIKEDVEPRYRPISNLGAIAMVGGLDMLFAANPEWKASVNTATDVVNSFVTGASSSLMIDEDSEIMKVARGMSANRVRVMPAE